jgi:ribonuclease VapC
MIIDSSVIVAILQGESEAAALTDALANAPIRRISAVSYVEAAVVVDSRRDAIFSRGFDDLLRNAHLAVEAVTPEQARLVREAYRDFGKGRHRAGLNLGDCFAYALAKDKAEPLLFKGNDFRRTDIEAAEWR